MLKPISFMRCVAIIKPAAFRRLCVETSPDWGMAGYYAPAAFRRLCVETTLPKSSSTQTVPAAFRRLCVETMTFGAGRRVKSTSRLQAAVC